MFPGKMKKVGVKDDTTLKHTFDNRERGTRFQVYKLPTLEVYYRNRLQICIGNYGLSIPNQVFQKQLLGISLYRMKSDDKINLYFRWQLASLWAFIKKHVVNVIFLYFHFMTKLFKNYLISSSVLMIPQHYVECSFCCLIVYAQQIKFIKATTKIIIICTSKKR